MNAPQPQHYAGAHPIRIGIAGVGAAARAFIPAVQAHLGFELVAAADPSEIVREDMGRELSIKTHVSVPEMLLQTPLDAIYVATPTELHSEHVLQALAAGKHVLVEKPMATNLADAKAMVMAADKADKVFMVGHSHSYDMPIQKMREIIEQGSLGCVRMVNTWCYTDWVYRPRRPDELVTALGGGVTYRQGSHQFDIIRLLCGGMVRSVKAKTFDWDPKRSAIGAHIVFLDFEDGAAATAVYNGYGDFSSMDMCFNLSEWGTPQPAESRRSARPPAIALSAEEELQAKRDRARHSIPGGVAGQPFFGMTLVSCERGDMRQSEKGLYVYSDGGKTEIEVPTERSPRDLVMAEFYGAIVGNKPARHDGRWGLANLEVCDAAIASSASGRDVLLTHQVSLQI